MSATGHVCFAHGQESGPWGTKIRALAAAATEVGWSVESLDYQGMPDPLDRVTKLVSHLESLGRPAVLAGSSMGGFVSVAAASLLPAAGLFLLAPALYVPGYVEYLPPAPACPTTIVHGWRDEVVPWEGSVRYAAAADARLILLDGDHRLTANVTEICRHWRAFLAELPAASA